MLARIAALAAAIVLLFTLAVTGAEARTDNRTKPIVFIHGLDAFGTAGADCNMWNNMINTLRAWGWTGTAATKAY